MGIKALRKAYNSYKCLNSSVEVGMQKIFIFCACPENLPPIWA